MPKRAKRNRAIHASISKESKEYASRLGSRLRSYQADPLYSNFDLKDLSTYLQEPFHEPYRHPSLRNLGPKPTFVFEYNLQEDRKPLESLSAYDDVAVFEAAQRVRQGSTGRNQLVFLVGRPSPEWLNAVGAWYGVDARFYQQHLGFVPTGQRHWYTNPSLPSRSNTWIRLSIPSIVFVGQEGRYVDPDGLQKARQDCDIQLRQSFPSLMTANDAADAGRSILRRINIHRGDCLVIEQELSVCLIKQDEHFRVVIWSDCGENGGISCMPIPRTEAFSNVHNHVEFCPVFFGRPVDETLEHRDLLPDTPSTTQQPLSLLPKLYSLTLDWLSVTQDPFYALQEAFSFQAASAVQYLNLLEKSISDSTVRDSVPDENGHTHAKIEDILNIDYTHSILVRYAAHFKDIAGFLQRKGGPAWFPPDKCSLDSITDAATSSLSSDFIYLVERAETLMALCEAVKAAILSNVSVEESRRSSHEARLVTELTKTTNRLTFIFLPISFVTSVFGMNFREFGQGRLSIWYWAAVTVPLLVVSMMVVERGRSMLRELTRVLARIRRSGS